MGLADERLERPGTSRSESVVAGQVVYSTSDLSGIGIRLEKGRMEPEIVESGVVG